MMQRILLTVMIGLFATATQGADQDLKGRLQETVDAFLAESPLAPGIVVHFISPSRDWDWTAVSGQAATGDDSDALLPSHTFRIASNTKTYVAAGLLRLVESGKLNLDDTLAQHLPARYQAPMRADGYNPEAMTIAQVLSHTSGMFEHPADPRYAEAILANPQRQWTRDEQFKLCLEWGDPVGEPGESYEYSDTGYLLLGAIIEETTGQSLGVAIHSLLDYEALGLDATWWEVDERQPETAGPRAHQYYGSHDTTDWNPSLDLYGGGGLLTDASDLAWFMRKLLQGEVFAQPATLAAMLERGSLPYRLGVMREVMSGHLVWGHTGFWNTFAFHVPGLDLTIAGAILNHEAGRGQVLTEKLVADILAAE